LARCDGGIRRMGEANGGAGATRTVRKGCRRHVPRFFVSVKGGLSTCEKYLKKKLARELVL